MQLQGPRSSICRNCLKLLQCHTLPQSWATAPRTRSIHGTRFKISNVDVLHRARNYATGYDASISRNTPAEMHILEKAIATRKLEEAYNSFMRLLPEKSNSCDWKSLRMYPKFQDLSFRLLDLIERDGGRIQMLPSPLDYIQYLKDNGIDVQRHYRRYYYNLLFSMVAEEADLKELISVFEMAVITQNDLFAAEEKHAQITSEEIEDMIHREERMLYIVYLYLRSKRADSPILKIIDDLIPFCNIPTDKEVQQTLDVRLFPPKLSKFLVKFCSEFKVRHVLRDRTRLRATLARFTVTNNLSGLEQLYTSARNLKPCPLNEFTYSCFISGFLTFWRSQTRALEVWEDMVQSGLEPQVSAWTALLRYGHSHDRSALSKIWSRMIACGVMPDVHCWTTFIHTQLQTDQVEAGLQTLDQMISSGTEPTIETINAAVDGLTRFDRMEQAFQVVERAASRGVTADLITYNTLLQGLMKRGAVEEANMMLEQMTKKRVKPDVITITILLDGLYKNARSIGGFGTAPETDRVHEVLQYMESQGIEANIATFTALVDGLLAISNFKAVEGIRQAMYSARVVGNAEFYTVMIKAAFRRGDIHTVDNLREELMKKGVRRDHVLWTEIILGYAQGGAIVKMQDAVRMMKQEQNRMIITLKGYVTILRALARRGERMVAKDVVTDIVNNWDLRKEVKKDGGGARIEEEFWDVVALLGGRMWMQGLRDGLRTVD